MELVRSLYARWAKGDLGGWDAVDSEIEFARIGPTGTGLDGEFRGVEALGTALAEWLESWTEITVQAERIVDLEDGRVLVLSHQTGRGRGSGTPLDLRMADIWTVRDGRLVRWETYWNRDDALEAAGLSE